MKNRVIHPLRLLLFMFLILAGMPSVAQYAYPIARTKTFDTIIYGQKLSDPYFWMSRKSNETEMLNYGRAQVLLTKSILDSVSGTEKLLEQWSEAYDGIDDELWDLQTVGNTIYYNRYIPGEGVWLCRRTTTDAAEEKILGKVIIHNQKYSIRKKVFAHHKPMLALMLTQSGEANPHIRIYDIEKKEFLPDSIGRVMFNDSRGVSMTWLPDDSGLLYTQAPISSISSQTYYNGQIKLHIPGTSAAKDEAIFGKGINPGIDLKEHETPYVYSFSHSPYIVARIRAGDADNYAFAVHYSLVNGNKTPWKRLKDYINLGDGFDARGRYLYAATPGGPHYQVVRIDMETGSEPVTILSGTPDPVAVTDNFNRSGIVAGKDVLYVLLRRIGDMQVIKSDYKTLATSYLPLKNKGSVADMALSDENDLVFASGSAVRSISYLRYHHNTNTVNAMPFAEKVYDASGELETQVVRIVSRDGKSIPVTLVYQKVADLKNNNPMLIESYGNSGATNDLFYNPLIMPWIRNGGIYAWAHVRGGGELGHDWVKDGQFPHKMNSVNDVVDVAAWFTENQYTSPSKLMVMGASAGSFLVGMSINQRPDLFAGGLFLSGLPDIVTYRDAAFARESRSVGPSGTREGFLSNYSISSYYQIPEAKMMPAMLIVHGATDYILDLHPAVRYTARLQQSQIGDKPIFLLVNEESGHMGSEMENLYIFKFALWQTGHPDFQIK